MRTKVVIEGSNPDGRMTGADLMALNGLDGDAPVKAKTTIGGWLKSLEVELDPDRAGPGGRGRGETGGMGRGDDSR
jgi:hypothetical protein